MEPSKDEDALVDLLDVVLRDGAVLRADVIVSVADVPLVGIKLTAAIAGMETMTEYGLFEEWDARRRKRAVARRQYDEGDEDIEAGDDSEELAQIVGVGSSARTSSGGGRSEGRAAGRREPDDAGTGRVEGEDGGEREEETDDGDG